VAVKSVVAAIIATFIYYIFITLENYGIKRKQQRHTVGQFYCRYLNQKYAIVVGNKHISEYFQPSKGISHNVQ